MARRGVRLVVLCEDEAHRRFSYNVFLGLGYHPRELYFRLGPAGRGAADQWVRKHYPPEVKSYRQKAHSQRVGLVVLIDADNLSVEDRHRELDTILEDEGLLPRSDEEAVVLWIPRRHIETWIAFLLGHQVDETVDCKALVRDADYRAPACQFVELCHSAAGQRAALPSMERALNELDRLRRVD